MSDTVAIAISVDSREDLKKVSGRISSNSQPKIELLSDPDHKTVDRYGLLNPENGKIPHPATYIIDKKGLVRWKQVDVDYTKRPSNSQILDALKSIDPG